MLWCHTHCSVKNTTFFTPLESTHIWTHFSRLLWKLFWCGFHHYSSFNSNNIIIIFRKWYLVPYWTLLSTRLFRVVVYKESWCCSLLYTFHNWRAQFLSNLPVHKPNTYKTSWIHSNLLVQTGVTILDGYSTKNKKCVKYDSSRPIILDCTFLYADNGSTLEYTHLWNAITKVRSGAHILHVTLLVE